MIAMRGPAKSDMSSQSWATHESSMDDSHFSDEMSDEVTIEQQRKEELAAMAPPPMVQSPLEAPAAPSNGSMRHAAKEPTRRKRSGPTQI